MAIKTNLPDAKIGDTFVQPWQFLNEADDTPIPQAGNRYTFSLKLDASVADNESVVLVDHTVPASADAANGIVAIRIEQSETLPLAPTGYQYELKQIIAGTPEDTVATLFYGKVKFEH